MLTETDNSRQIDRLGNGIRAYKIASGRTLAFAMIKAGRELAFALHKETARITPTEETIRAVPTNAGWNMRPRPASKGTDRSHEVRRQIQMHQGVENMINARVRSRYFHAAGWKPAIHGFIRADTVTTFNKKLGAVIAQVDMSGKCHIIELNRAGVIQQVTDRFQILRKAVNDVFRGFAPYIKRKLGEEARKAFWKL